jgi:predicted permease
MKANHQRRSSLFSQKSRESELDRELEAHLEEEAEEQERAGLSRGEAQYAARRALGNTARIKEEVRMAWGTRQFETLSQDLRYAFRMFVRNPGFTALAVLSLAVGIGGNTAMFSILNAVLIGPLPYPHASRLVNEQDYYPPGAIVALQQWSRTMDLAAVSPGIQLNLTGEGEAQRLSGEAVSANLFSVLGAAPKLGRAFRPGEDVPGEDDVVVLSHALWTDKFGGNPDVIGKTIALGGTGRRVVGIMPARFDFPTPSAQFWIPLRLDPRDQRSYWDVNYMPMVGRLKPGATLQEAQSEIRTMTDRVRSIFPYAMARNWNADVTVVPLQQSMVRNIRGKLMVLQVAVGLVLLIACLNVAGLLLARATAREKEMALRAALGAGPARIARQLLTESVLLGILGGAVGIALASLSLSVLKLALSENAMNWGSVHTGWQVLLFASLVSILAGVAFGLAPAASTARQNLAEGTKSGARSSAGAAHVRLRSVLIASEVALAVVLAVSAGLLIKSLWLLTKVNPGFDPQKLVTMQVSPSRSLCRQRAACVALYGELLERTREITGVSAVTAASTIPLDQKQTAYVPLDLEGHPRNPLLNASALFGAFAVMPGYFRTMQIPLVEGRRFTNTDNEEKSTPVIIVSAATARRYWPGENPIGKHIRIVWETGWRTVVGVVGDVRQYNMAGSTPNYLTGTFYMPYAQSTNSQQELPVSMSLIARVRAGSPQISGSIRDLVRELNPNVPVSAVRTMESVVTESTRQSRSMAWFFACFAAVALLLAAVGAYGVISFSVARRTSEIGVRLALGATPFSVFGLILRQTLQLILAGLAAGIAASLLLLRALGSFLYGISFFDPATYFAVCFILVVAGLIAGFMPARRAAAVDPVVALRQE